jgi:starvation-inducible outer membrane lipoprotein
MRGSTIPLAVLTLTLAGCWTPPQLRGDYVSIDPGQGSAAGLSGTPVRWGGIVTGAKETNAGFCVEIAAYKLDAYTQKPAAPSLYQEIYRYRANKINPVNPGFESPPRFLACGDQVRDKSLYFPSSISTVVGTLGSAEVFEVNPADCMRAGYVDYSGTDHAIGGGRCIVSLPVVHISQSYAWPEAVFHR